ncbi:CAMK family protein kinase [Histomonas meleagridis]|uniref:CAMK family protein kinase n=1 Tax=Histomonas meleagridis TaxID=135588 RepID=UPI0035599279|nr:CAMK family protein kinase [Histomonas meleagridis]KAH0801870.1 CAMK family protein kinase [Histomonas meleagridis]
MAVGSPAYQAPESFLDNVDFRNLDPSKEDIWSLGVTLYQSFFGKLPFEGESVFEIVAKIKTTSLSIPNGTDPVKVSLLKHMLCVNHLKRFNVYQTLQHPFFDKKSETFDASQIEQMERPTVDPNAEIVSIRATVCDDSFSFSRPTITPQAQLRAINPEISDTSVD